VTPSAARPLPRWLLPTGAALVAATFALDIALPQGFAAAVPYVAPVLLGLWAPRSLYALVAAGVTSLLTAAGALAPLPEEDRLVLVVSNRLLSLLGIWVAALVVWWHGRLQREVEDERRERDEVLDVAEVMLLWLDTQARVTRINRKGAEILGLPAPEIVGQPWIERFVPAGERKAVREAFEAVIRGELTLHRERENGLVTGDGARMIAWTNALLRGEGGEVVGTLSSGHDVTESRRAAAEARRNLEELTQLKHALDQASIVATTDARGIITYVNDKFCEISRYSRAELLGRTHRIVHSGHHPREFFADLWQTITAGKVWRGEIKNRAKDGTLYWVDTTIVPFLDAEGRPWQHVAIRNDITEKKRAQQRLAEQSALARLGAMAAVVAHEVRNPLAGIGGALQVIAKRLPPDSPDVPIIREMLTRIGALNGMVEDMLLFARPRALRPTRVELSALVCEAVELLQRDPTFRDVRIAVEPATCELEADAELLKDVVFNLLLNAAQAMGGKGSVDVRIEPTATSCRLRIADRGPGIPPERREVVFEPFVTTKHRGTGLGLAIARRVVEQHGGTIVAEETSGGGATMAVELPRRSG
jgi:PAS domain S-box-containing protein